MEAIKYHLNRVGNEYGADHTLTNNWNPDTDYGKDYVNIYFRIETNGYGYPNFSFSEEEGKAFDDEVINVFKELGWTVEKGSFSGRCATILKGKQHLYLHPQNFSGEILKNEVKQIAEALQKHDTFYLRWVDLYETVYDISDTEYEEYLVKKDEEIRKILFEQCQTKRTNKYFYVFDVCRNLAEKIRLRRVGLNDGRNSGSGQTIEHIKEIIDKMIKEGLLVSVEINGNECVRSLNKTEQKKLKLMIA